MKIFEVKAQKLVRGVLRVNSVTGNESDRTVFYGAPPKMAPSWIGSPARPPRKRDGGALTGSPPTPYTKMATPAQKAAKPTGGALGGAGRGRQVRGRRQAPTRAALSRGRGARRTPEDPRRARRAARSPRSAPPRPAPAPLPLPPHSVPPCPGDAVGAAPPLFLAGSDPRQQIRRRSSPGLPLSLRSPWMCRTPLAGLTLWLLCPACLQVIFICLSGLLERWMESRSYEEDYGVKGSLYLSAGWLVFLQCLAQDQTECTPFIHLFREYRPEYERLRKTLDLMLLQWVPLS
ncbi:rabphilin-3A-like [Corapipo altera]|uniref:rabphilin-3A-like n=1 Tax=Corapipo altera TaxID=415028 RepID=UPI000FD66115|nr:rabphilin-3A-like [Corapipo altera]